jgi:anti-sigma factor RsiW
VNLSVQHLSDEAVTAFADGMLGVGPRNRASRHIDQCPECAGAIAEQRAAVSALRAAPDPALPFGLLERLRAVPVTTTLNSSPPMSLAPDGSPVFPAYGTSEGSPVLGGSSFGTHSFATHSFGSHSAGAASTHRGVARRTQQFALVATAAAMLTIGMAASAAASTNESRLPSFSPAGGSVQPAIYPAGRARPAELVGAVTGNSNR